MPMERGADFLLAIKEVSGTVYDDDAAEFLDGICKLTTAGLDKMGATGEKRDRMLFFEGMLRGVQVKLARVRIEAAAELRDRQGKPLSEN